MWLSRFFEHIVVISLAHRADRRARVIRELQSLGVDVGRTPGVELFDAIRPTEADGFPSAARRGCFLSHRAVARRALEEGWDRVLVIEDDMVFTPAVHTAGPRLAADLDRRPWHVAFFGYLQAEFPPGGPDWQPVHPKRRGTHCYAINGSILPQLVEYMDLVTVREPGHPDGARFGADATYVMFGQRTPGCVTLMARPNLAVQGSSASDLSPKWFDLTPGIRNVASMARRVREALRQRSAWAAANRAAARSANEEPADRNPRVQGVLD